MPDKIYRFDQLRYAKPFLEEGLVSFGPATLYKDSKLTDAQRDDEGSRTVSPDTARYQLGVASGSGQPQPLQNVVSLKVTFDIKDINGDSLRYHILCCSLACEQRFYDEFPVDCCIAIHEPVELHRRLDLAVKDQLPEWGGQARRVQYYAPDAMVVPKSTLDLIFMKDTNYSWQHEFRYALISPLAEAHANRVSLRLGSLADICSIETK